LTVARTLVRPKRAKAKAPVPVKAPKPPTKRGKLPPIPMPFLLATLKKTHPGARCSLDYRNAFELLVATILSAQCTDERVNLTTPEVFRRWPDAPRLADADLPEVEEVIRSTGFFRMRLCSRTW
jgi:endonuclease III